MSVLIRQLWNGAPPPCDVLHGGGDSKPSALSCGAEEGGTCPSA